MSTKISIQNPCNQNWNKMTSGIDGRYCDVCKLTVVDFTNMTDDEIQKYLTDKSYVCGRFKYSQVNNQGDRKLILLKEKIERLFEGLNK